MTDGEKLNKLDGMIKQTELMLDLKANAEVSPFFFDIEIVISKRLATEENIKIIKGLLDTMSADDQPHSFRVHEMNYLLLLNEMEDAINQIIPNANFKYPNDFLAVGR